jgi:hypothetical protein
LPDPDQVVATFRAPDNEEPFCQAHGDLRMFRWAQRAAPGPASGRRSRLRPGGTPFPLSIPHALAESHKTAPVGPSRLDVSRQGHLRTGVIATAGPKREP